jgi:hypothetical protein
MLEIERMFVRHPSTKLRMTIGLKISVRLSLSKPDERMLEIMKMLIVTLRPFD